MNVRFTQPKGIVLSIFSALPQHWNLCTTSERTAASKTMLHPVLPSAPKQMALRWTNPTLPLPGFRALTPADGHHQVVYWTWRYPKGFYGICINRNHISEKNEKNSCKILIISILGFQPCESVLWPGSFLKGDILIAKAVKSILEGFPRNVGFHGFCQVVG